MAQPVRSHAHAALRRAARPFRCRTCRQLVRAKWNLSGLGRIERLMEEHGTHVERCPRSGRLVEVAAVSFAAEVRREFRKSLSYDGDWK